LRTRAVGVAEDPPGARYPLTMPQADMTMLLADEIVEPRGRSAPAIRFEHDSRMNV